MSHQMTAKKSQDKIKLNPKVSKVHLEEILRVSICGAIKPNLPNLPPLGINKSCKNVLQES